MLICCDIEQGVKGRVVLLKFIDWKAHHLGFYHPGQARFLSGFSGLAGAQTEDKAECHKVMDVVVADTEVKTRAVSATWRSVWQANFILVMERSTIFHSTMTLFAEPMAVSCGSLCNSLG